MTKRAKSRVRTVGFGQRLQAALWDSLLVFVASFVLVIVIGVVLIGNQALAPDRGLPFVELVLFAGILLSLFYTVGLWSTAGQTFGMARLGIKVVGPDGKPLSIWRALLRWLGLIVGMAVLSIGLIWIEFNPRRRGWHDYVAGTHVIAAGHSFTDASRVEWLPGDKGKGWVRIVVWVLVALLPVGLSALSLFVLSPSINGFMTALLGG